MPNHLAAVSLGLAALATAGAGWALVENRKLRVQLEERALLPSARVDPLTGAPVDADGLAPLPPAEVARRLQAIETRVAVVDASVAAQERQVRELAATAEVRGAMPADPGAPAVPAGAVAGDTAAPADPTAQAALIKRMVAKEVAAAKIKDEKKPTLERFAAHLQLSDVQKDGVVREIVRAQRDLMDVLKQPTQDGTVFLDQLVDVFATAATDQSKAGPKMMQLFARITTEKIPGTDTTYLTRIEGIKAGVKETFRRDFTPEQWAAYQQMGVAEDPTELQNVPGSPWQELMQRVADRLPEDQRKALEAQQGK